MANYLYETMNTRMTTFIKAKTKKSDRQTKSDKYRLAAHKCYRILF